MSFNALVYHEIRNDLPTEPHTLTALKAANDYAIGLPPALFLNIADFTQQMTYLVEENFHFLSMQDIRDYYEKGRELPEKSLFISFDDAFQSVYTTAYPILKKLGIKATLFVVSGWLFDETSDVNSSCSQVMSWEQLNSMSDVFELANHTHHLHTLVQPGVNGLMTATFDELKADLEQCQVHVQHQDTFAYPFGFYNQEVVENLKQLGFNYAFTTQVGPNNQATPTLELNRTLVYHQMPFERFKELVHAKTQ